MSKRRKAGDEVRGTRNRCRARENGDPAPPGRRRRIVQANPETTKRRALSDQSAYNSDYVDFSSLALLTGWSQAMIFVLAFRASFTRIKVDAAQGGGSGKRTLVDIFDPVIPPDARARYFAARGVPEIPSRKQEAILYLSLPGWARRSVDARRDLFESTAGLRGRELREFLAFWNAEAPSAAVSYPTFKRLEARYRASGIAGLVPRYGRLKGRTRK